MIVILRMTVPVYVTVDTDAAEVTRVVVADEAIAPSRRIERDVDGRPVPATEAMRARDIAADADWPAWEIG